MPRSWWCFGAALCMSSSSFNIHSDKEHAHTNIRSGIFKRHDSSNTPRSINHRCIKKGNPNIHLKNHHFEYKGLGDVPKTKMYLLLDDDGLDCTVETKPYSLEIYTIKSWKCLISLRTAFCPCLHGRQQACWGGSSDCILRLRRP